MHIRKYLNDFLTANEMGKLVYGGNIDYNVIRVTGNTIAVLRGIQQTNTNPFK